MNSNTNPMGKNKEAIEALQKSLDALKNQDAIEDKTVDEGGAEAGGDAELKEAAKTVAKEISAALNLDKVDKLFALLEKASVDEGVAKLFEGKSVEKDLKALTKDEKIVAFTKALLTDNKAVVKALSEGTAADGGYLFPNEFYAEIIKALVAAPRMRALVRVIPMRKDVIDIPTEGAKATVFWGSENTSITTTTADFGTAQLTAYRMNSILYMSRELAEDATEIGVVDLIISQFADAVGEEEDKVIIAGSGSGQPTGLLEVTGHHSVTCSGNLDYDDIIDAFYALPKQYRAGAVWLVNTVNLKELQKIKDSNGNYLWRDALVQGGLPTLLGRSVVENSWVPEANIFFADLKRGYYLGDRQQMTVETTTEAGGAWEKHQVGIKVIERLAGKPVLADAIAEIVSIP